jgi:hypothetical protein
VFQAQPDVSHVYLGSKRHLLERIFNDRNEPFWRSAKQLEIGMIPPKAFAGFIRKRFAATGKRVANEAVERLLRATGGHPYGTQELAYFVWELVESGSEASVADVEEAVTRVLRSEHNHLTRIWDDASHAQRLLMLALAAEPTRSIYSSDYHAQHELPATPTLQSALAGLTRKELVGRNADGDHCVIEPFLAEWLEREQRGYGVDPRLRREPPRRGAQARRRRARPRARVDDD